MENQILRLGFGLFIVFKFGGLITMIEKKLIIRITTVPISMEKLLNGQLMFINKHYKVLMISSEKENLKKLGTDLEIDSYYVNLTRKITPLTDLFSLIKLTCFLIKTKPFIVHTHTPKAGTIGMLAAYIARVPNRLHTVAGLPLLETTGVKRWLLNLVEKLTYFVASKIYPNSNGLKNIILEMGFTRTDKLNVLGNGSSNGIDTKYFSPESVNQIEIDNLKNKLNINSKDFVFIFVGRLVKDKGLNELIIGFEQIVINNSNTKLLLVGKMEDDLDPLLPEVIKKINDNGNIINVGFQNEVRKYFSIADVLVFPSYREGFPNVVMQAGAMGLPSIVTNINGCNEIIENNLNGLIIPSKNTDELIKAMELIIKNDSLRLKFKSNARKIIVDRYEQQLVWEAILSEYKKLDKNV
jgi:glycosyltransferase involved in cell wall biosynthesis